MTKDLTAVGMDILYHSRNELYMSLPYMDTALCALAFAPGDGITVSAATDGDTLYYSGSFLAERFLRGTAVVNRLYLHMILHCLLRHIGKKRGKARPELWDIACDAAVESILDSLEYPCLRGTTAPFRQKFYGQCRQVMPVLTAEGIYRYLLRENLSEYEYAALARQFFADDHGAWDMERQDEQNQRQDERWKDMAEKTQTAMETVLSGQATGGDAVLEQVKVSARDDIDYRAFLRRFAAPKEVLAVDGDAFDYAYYTYGLQLYGNLPLVEPPETREERRIEDFVIAIDTSMSTSGALVRQFLACTYTVLRSTGTFTRAVNIRILQCDDQLRSDTAIHNIEELREYMDSFQLIGGSATDFRPVFDHVAELQKAGVFSSLRGLLYFTDGMGIFPQKRPPYETAFILLEEPPLSVKFPPWAIQLTLTLPELEKAVQDTAEEFTEEYPWKVMPEL